MVSFFAVTILSTFTTDGTLRPFSLLGETTYSFLDSSEGMTDDIAQTIRSAYLSAVSEITAAGRAFTYVSSAKGNGMRTISPVLTRSEDNPDTDLLSDHSKMQSLRMRK